MKIKHIYILFILAGLGLSACNNEFETLRKEGSSADRYAKAQEYLKEGDCQKAMSLYELVIGAYRGRPEQEDIYFDYAKSHHCQGNYISSAYYFKNFSSTYPNSKHREEADYLAADSHYQMSDDYKLDQTATQKAIDEFQLFVNTHPDSEKVAKCNRLIDECRNKLERRAFYESNLYFNLKEYQAATISFENLLREYPDTPRAEEVRYLITKASFEWAENSVLKKQEERYEAAVKSGEEFMARHKGSEYTREIKNILKVSNDKLKEIKA